MLYCKLSSGIWKWFKYDADGIDKLMLPTALSTASINSNQSGVLLLDGIMRNDGWGLVTLGMSPVLDVNIVYCSDTAGGMSFYPPSIEEDQVVVAGILVGENVLRFSPGYTWLETSGN